MALRINATCVDAAVYVGLMQSSSKGAFYNQHIRGRYR